MTTTRIAAAIWLTAAVSYGRENGQNLTVCLRFSVADRLVIRSLAQDLAKRMFADAGISLAWMGAEPGGGVLNPPIVIQAVGDTPPEFMPEALAFAELSRGGRITVFLDRVEKHENPAVVLAHVLVHEITHVLQGVGRHSTSGVMKARWTGRDYSEMRLRPLRFAPEDLDLIRQAMSMGAEPAFIQGPAVRNTNIRERTEDQ